jgi:4-amino-4-deoxy-L-arabinose transferase-like glycosyltransferase
VKPTSAAALLPSRQARRGFWRPVLFAALVRLALFAALPTVPVWDGVIYERAGARLAAGEGFTRAVLAEGQPEIPTAFFPVGFPAVLSVLRAAGAGRSGDLALQVLAGIALVPLVGLLGRRLGGARAGRHAAWWVALWPGGIFYSLSWMSEPIFALLSTSAVVLLAFGRRARRERRFVAAAVLLALAAYVRPVAVPILAILALMDAAFESRPLRAFARRAGIAAVIVTAIHLPWMLRNQAELGAPAFVSTNGGANLLLGTLGEGHFGEIPADVDCSPDLPEIAKDRCRSARAWARMREAPEEILPRALLKLTHTFGHESAPAYGWARSIPPRAAERAELWALASSRVFWLALLAAAAWGAQGRRGRVFWLNACPILGVALLHAVVLGGDRYHAPAAPMLCVLASMWTSRRAGVRVHTSTLSSVDPSGDSAPPCLPSDPGVSRSA